MTFTLVIRSANSWYWNFHKILRVLLLLFFFKRDTWTMPVAKNHCDLSVDVSDKVADFRETMAKTPRGHYYRQSSTGHLPVNGPNVLWTKLLWAYVYKVLIDSILIAIKILIEQYKTQDKVRIENGQIWRLYTQTYICKVLWT